MKTLSVFFPESLESTSKQTLQAALSDGIHIYEDTVSPNGYDVLVEGEPTIDMIIQNPALHSVIIPYAGVPESTRNMLLDFPNIKVYNLHHNAMAVAEFTLALVLAAVKNIIPMHNALLHGNWSLRYNPSNNGMLHDKNVLIMGYGAIGQAVAHLLSPFNVRISAIKKNVISEKQMLPAQIHPLEDLHTLLPNTDFLIITLPLTEETNGLISTAAFALLPTQAIVVNVGPGDVINQHALYAALRSKKIAGAAIDRLVQLS